MRPAFLQKNWKRPVLTHLHVAQANHTGNMGDTIPAMGTQPYGFMVSYSKKIKELVSIPVSVVGRIVTPEAAEAVTYKWLC